MENASKALLIAGGVLLGVLILALVVFFWTNMSIFVASGSSESKEQQIRDFNMEFETFNRGQTESKVGTETITRDSPIYGSDIITIVNKIETYNKNPDEVFNSKIQYKPIDVTIVLGDANGDLESGSLANLDIFSQLNSGVTTERGKKVIKNVAENKLFRGTNKNLDGSVYNGIMEKYLKIESTYGKDFMNKLSANYQRILDLMHVREVYDSRGQSYGICSRNKSRKLG